MDRISRRSCPRQITGVLVALTALVAGPLASAPETGPRPLPAAHHISGVPFAARERNWCGPSALAAVLQFHGEKATAAQIAKDIYLPNYHGSLNLDLLLWARKRGMQVWAATGEADRIKGAVVRDRPVICMVRRRGRLADRNHFVIVRGYDEEKQVWLLDEGNGREEPARMADFGKDWRECGRWMMVVEGKKTPARPEGKREGG